MIIRQDGCFILLCAPEIVLYENSDKKIGNLEEDEAIEIINHSQRIFAFIQSNNFSTNFSNFCITVFPGSSDPPEKNICYICIRK